MTTERTTRGFTLVIHPTYGERTTSKRLIGESSAIGEYADSIQNPGSSFLWVADHFHLNREEVRELRDHLARWLETGRL